MYFLGRSISRTFRPIVRGLSTSNAQSRLLTIHPEVADALARGGPVVALESTVITHGLGYPDNLKTAISCEDNVRANGAIPATIALIDGRMHIGLERKHLEVLADVESLKSAGKAPIKLSRRDIAPAMSLGCYGGTTIAGTAVLAHLAGIKIFATGGLGGVHRGGETSLDISADLTELGRTPIAVIASGAKSILDIGRTLEFLETQGVTVAAYNNDGDWPAFFTAKSGYKAPWAFNNPRDAAKSIYFADQLNVQSGTIFGVPIPKEYEKIGLEIQTFVGQAVQESIENGVAKSGRDATPWLLSRVRELTKGSSVPSNIALLENNARIGAQIAVEYTRLKSGGSEQACSHQPALKPAKYNEIEIITKTAPNLRSPLVIVGAAAVDIISQPYADSPSAVYSTSPGSVKMAPGGVARNVAEAAHRVLQSLSSASDFELNKPLLISSVGQDTFASVLKLEIESRGMRTDGLMRLSGADERTATCNMFLDSRGDLQMGVADMSIIEDKNIDTEKLLRKIEDAAPSIVAVDGNLSSETISVIVEKAKQLGSMIFFEPTSTAKCSRMIPALSKMIASGQKDPYITGAFPNGIELRSMWEATKIEDDLLSSSYWWSVVDTFGSDLHRTLARQIRGDMAFLLSDGIIQMATQLLPFIKCFIIKCGSKGVVLVSHVTDKEGAMAWISEFAQSQKQQIVSRASDGSALVVKHFPAHVLPASLSTMNVTGAGDTLVGALLAAMVYRDDVLLSPARLAKVMGLGQRCAVETIKSPFAVSPTISAMVHPALL